MLHFQGKAVIPWWGVPLRFASALAVNAYVRIAYRIRGWGELPSCRGSALVLSNHQIDLDVMAIVSAITLRGGWRAPFLAASARLLHETGFLAIRVPWLWRLFNGVNCAWLFNAMGMLPIENEIHTRSMLRWAFNVERLHGPVPLREVFSAATNERIGGENLRTSDLFRRKYFGRAQRTAVRLSALLPPHRREQLERTRRGVEEDLDRIEACMRSGATFYVTPEGEYTRDGAMLRFRGIWDRLAPLADTVYLIGVSYDPFAGPRFSQLYRICKLRDREKVVEELKTARPVTASAVLCSWLAAHPEPFVTAALVSAAQSTLRTLPPALFVDPEFAAQPERTVRKAVARMQRSGVLTREGQAYKLSVLRRHPMFPNVADIVAFQARFLDESIDAAHRLAPPTPEIDIAEIAAPVR